MHPLYPFNDAPPCTPLPIVKRVSAMKPHKSRILGIAKGGAFAPPWSRFCTPLPAKTGHGNLNIRQSFYFLYPVHCSYLLAQWYPAWVSLPLNELFLLMHTPKTRSFSQRTDLPDSRLPIQCSQVAQHLRFSRTLINITPFINDSLNFHA